MDHKALPCAFSHGSCKKTRRELLLLRPFYKLGAQRKRSGLFEITQLKTKLNIQLCFSVLHIKTVQLRVPPTTPPVLNQHEKAVSFAVSSEYQTHSSKHTCHVSLSSAGLQERSRSGKLLTWGREARSAQAPVGLRLRGQQTVKTWKR